MTKTAVNDYVCDALRRLRIEQGLRVRDIAARTGIPSGSYACMEMGRYRMNMDNLFRTLHALGARIADVWPEAPGQNGPAEQVSDQYVGSVLEEARRRRPRRSSVEDVIEAVCRVYGIDRRTISGPLRVRPLSEARSLAALLAEDEPHLSRSELSRALLRDPSALTHSSRRLKRRLASDKALHRRLKEARRLFGRIKGSDPGRRGRQ